MKAKTLADSSFSRILDKYLGSSLENMAERRG